MFALISLLQFNNTNLFQCSSGIVQWGIKFCQKKDNRESMIFLKTPNRNRNFSFGMLILPLHCNKTNGTKFAGIMELAHFCQIYWSRCWCTIFASNIHFHKGSNSFCHGMMVKISALWYKKLAWIGIWVHLLRYFKNIVI